METPSPASVAAAEWWARQVEVPTFRNTDGRASPKERLLSDLAGVAASLRAETHSLDAAASREFARLLALGVDALLAAAERSRAAVSLRVDYGPDEDLAAAADKAGVSLARFPWKTHMLVRRDHVVASLGYRAAWRLVWQAPEWSRPLCGSREHDPMDEATGRVCGLPVYHDGGHNDWARA